MAQFKQRISTQSVLTATTRITGKTSKSKRTVRFKDQVDAGQSEIDRTPDSEGSKFNSEILESSPEQSTEKRHAFSRKHASLFPMEQSQVEEQPFNAMITPKTIAHTIQKKIEASPLKFKIRWACNEDEALTFFLQDWLQRFEKEQTVDQKLNYAALDKLTQSGLCSRVSGGYWIKWGDPQYVAQLVPYDEVSILVLPMEKEQKWSAWVKEPKEPKEKKQKIVSELVPKPKYKVDTSTDPGFIFRARESAVELYEPAPVVKLTYEPLVFDDAKCKKFHPDVLEFLRDDCAIEVSRNRFLSDLQLSQLSVGYQKKIHKCLSKSSAKLGRLRTKVVQIWLGGISWQEQGEGRQFKLPTDYTSASKLQQSAIRLSIGMPQERYTTHLQITQYKTGMGRYKKADILAGMQDVKKVLAQWDYIMGEIYKLSCPQAQKFEEIVPEYTDLTILHDFFKAKRQAVDSKEAMKRLFNRGQWFSRVKTIVHENPCEARDMQRVACFTASNTDLCYST